jgi:hypothetical protein
VLGRSLPGLWETRRGAPLTRGRAEDWGEGFGGAVRDNRRHRRRPTRGHDPGQDCAARDAMAQDDQNASRNVSPGGARHIWRRRSVSPLHGRAHRLDRRTPRRGLLVPMDLTCDLRHPASNCARRVAAR